MGKNEPALGTRFPDMSEPYANTFIEKAKQIASANKIKVHEGVYVGVTGPTLKQEQNINSSRFQVEMWLA